MIQQDFTLNSVFYYDPEDPSDILKAQYAAREWIEKHPQKPAWVEPLRPPTPRAQPTATWVCIALAIGFVAGAMTTILFL